MSNINVILYHIFSVTFNIHSTPSKITNDLGHLNNLKPKPLTAKLFTENKSRVFSVCTAWVV